MNLYFQLNNEIKSPSSLIDRVMLFWNRKSIIQNDYEKLNKISSKNKSDFKVVQIPLKLYERVWNDSFMYAQAKAKSQYWEMIYQNVSYLSRELAVSNL